MKTHKPCKNLTKLGLLGLSICQSTLVLLCAFSANAAETKPSEEVLSKALLLTKIKEAQTAQLEKVNLIQQNVNRRLSDTQTLTVDTEAVKSPLRGIAEELEIMQKQKREYLLRRDFLDELMLRISSKWDGQPLKSFVEGTLMDIAETHLNSMGKLEETIPQHQSLWRFSLYLNAALRASPLAAKDVFPFVMSYLETSGVGEPKTPEQFFLRKDYSNGLMSIGVPAVKPSEPGDVLETKQQRSNRRTRMPKVLELRIKAPETESKISE